MEIQTIAIVLSVLSTVITGYLAFIAFLEKRERIRHEHSIKNIEDSKDLEIKVKDLEGKIATQYNELKTELSSLKKSMDDERYNKHVFEARVLSILDKTDSKMEKIQDLVLQVYVHNNKPNQTK